VFRPAESVEKVLWFIVFSLDCKHKILIWFMY
jgi:hypothetical protein